MERLAALYCLWAFELGNKEDYFAELDRLFLESPEDDFLLELEGLNGDRAAAWKRLSPLVGGSLNADAFGRELFGGLEKYYSENCGSFETFQEFGKRCYEMWQSFPASIDEKDPFHTLSYADDPLSYGDEKRSRELYEAAFEHYKEKL